MLIFNTLTTAAVAKFSFNPAATKPCVTLVCLQEGTSPFHSVHKEIKQRAAQVSCWWMLSQVQPEDTSPLESMGGMDQGCWTLHSNKPYMTQCISEEQQECLFPRSTQEHHHQKAGENTVILDQSLRSLASSLSRGRRNCAFGSREWLDNRGSIPRAPLSTNSSFRARTPQCQQDQERSMGCAFARGLNTSKHSGGSQFYYKADEVTARFRCNS